MSAKILIVDDGKTGHRNQSLGLAEAILSKVEGVELEFYRVPGIKQILRDIFFNKKLKNHPNNSVSLIIGAGRKTHIPIILLKILFKAPAIVIMRPSLPYSLYDLCVIPAHDNPSLKKNIFISIGPLNRIRKSTKDRNTGMILVGGPSKNIKWDNEAILRNIKDIVTHNPRKWVISSSRRTPKELSEQLKMIYKSAFYCSEATPPDWLPEQLGKAETCWVTEDSASMIYEALTAGCRVGIITLPNRKQRNKLKRMTSNLLEQGIITKDPDWKQENLKGSIDLDEASRCADYVIKAGLIGKPHHSSG